MTLIERYVMNRKKKLGLVRIWYEIAPVHLEEFAGNLRHPAKCGVCIDLIVA